MDLIVTACRALANRNRLRLLRAIHAQPGVTAHALATTTALPAESVSKHLKLLVGLRLVAARPQGRCVHYAPPQPRATSHPFLRDLQFLTQDLFCATPSKSTLGQVWNETPASGAASEQALMKLFTTYTHLRRLLLLRQLLRHGPCSTAQLIAGVGISNQAVHRQLRKLQRRGAVTVTEKIPVLWQLARPVGCACQRQLLDDVLRALAAKSKVAAS